MELAANRETVKLQNAIELKMNVLEIIQGRRVKANSGGVSTTSIHTTYIYIHTYISTHTNVIYLIYNIYKIYTHICICTTTTNIQRTAARWCDGTHTVDNMQPYLNVLKVIKGRSQSRDMLKGITTR